VGDHTCVTDPAQKIRVVRTECGTLTSVPFERLVVVVESESSEGLKGMALCTLACLPLQSVVPVASVLTVRCQLHMAAVLSGVMALLVKAVRPSVAFQQEHCCSEQTVAEEDLTSVCPYYPEASVKIC